MFELVCNVAFIVGYIRLTTLFFRKSKVAPRFYILLSTLRLGFVVIDTYLDWLLSPGLPLLDFETLRMLVFHFSSTVIWGTYMLNSEQVAKTFIFEKSKVP